MQRFRADLHIHTVLSPCGSLEMTPVNIVNAAIEAGLDIIAITDHNTTRQIPLLKLIAEREGIFVIGGSEVNSKEEVHCLTLFETDKQLFEFQDYIDQHLIKIKNKPDYFGYQVVVDENEQILYEEPWLLINSLDVGIIEIEQKVHSLKGLFIPAHIDRHYNSIIRQLGFVPQDLLCDAFELSDKTTKSDWLTSSKLPVDAQFIRNSDAHQPEDIAKQYTEFEIEGISFEEIRKAFKGTNGRIASISM